MASLQNRVGNRLFKIKINIDKALKIHEAFSYNNISEEHDLPYSVLGVLLPTYKSQKAAPIIEKFVIKRLGGVKNKASNRNGDFTVDTKSTELKISQENEDNTQNLRQVRLGHDIDQYLVMAVRPNPKDCLVWCLTKEEINTESILLSATNTHQTKQENAENKHCEKSMNFKLDPTNTHYIRWQQYLREDLRIKIFED